MLAALPFRIPAAQADLPNIYDFDEPFFINDATSLVKQRTLRPADQRYGAVFKYATAAEVTILEAVGMDPSRDWNWQASQPGDTRVRNPTAWFLIRLFPALLGAIGAGLIVLTAWELGARPETRLLVGALGILAPLAVTGFAKVSADPWATFFIIVAGWWLAKATRHGLTNAGTLPYLVAAGAASGLAAGSKFNASLFVIGVALAPVVAHGVRNYRKWAPQSFATGIAGALALALSNPFIVLDTQGFLSDIKIPRTSYALWRPGEEGRPFIFQLGVLFDNSLILGVLAVAAVILAFSLKKRALPWVAAAAVGIIATIAVHSQYNVRQARNVLPLLGPVLVLGGLGGQWLWDWTKSRFNPQQLRAAYGTAIFVATVMVGTQGWKAVDATQRSLGDERAEARTVVTELLNDDPSAQVWLEGYAPGPFGETDRISGGFGRIEASRLDIDDFKYYVFSSDTHATILSDRARYPDLIAKYEEVWDKLCIVGRYSSYGTTIEIYEDCE